MRLSTFCGLHRDTEQHYSTMQRLRLPIKVRLHYSTKQRLRHPIEMRLHMKCPYLLGFPCREITGPVLRDFGGAFPALSDGPGGFDIFQ
jgi:hypothetical protein